jgi:hypothetical protein
MTGLTSTTRARQEATKRAGAVKGIDETDPNDMAFKLVTIFVFSLCCEYSFFLNFIFSAIRSSNHSFSRLSAALEAVPLPIAAPDNDDRDEGMVYVSLNLNQSHF